MTDPDVQIINARLDEVSREISALTVVTRSVADSLLTLVRLEEGYKNMARHQDTTDTVLSKQEIRIQAIEMAMPGLKELRAWVIGGVLAGVGMMGAALLKLVIVDVPAMRYPQHTPPAVYGAPLPEPRK